MSEVEVAGARYRIGALNVRVKAQLARRLAPAMVGVGAIRSLAEKANRAMSSADLARAFVAQAGDLSADAFDAAVSSALSVVAREDKGAWAPVQAPNGTLMYPLELNEMMELVWRSLAENEVTDFFGVPRSTSGGATEATSNGPASPIPSTIG